jgi:hypothetical protein
MRILAGIGVVFTAAIIYVGGLVAYHLYQDHAAYHSNAQLLELVRTAVVELHPELLEEEE